MTNEERIDQLDHHVKIQVNTDTNIGGGADLAERTEAEISGALDRFKDRLTRIEVHLGNESAGRSTGEDFRCLIEARPARMDPVVVTHHAATLPDAIRGSTDKLEALLSSKFEQLESQDSRETIRGR